jgi:drug/metabolite transporter, DME family
MGGAYFCLASAVAYTLSNICMRQLTTMGCDPIWAVFNRETVAVVLVGPWLMYKMLRRRSVIPPWRTLGAVLAVGLLIEVLGNVLVQWAMGIVGLAVTVPSIYGASITGSAVLAWLLLGERVSRRSASAIALLLAALVLLGIGAEAAGRSGPVSASTGVLLLGVLACGTAGTVFSMLNIVIRHALSQATQPAVIAFFVTLMGSVSLGPISLARFGVEQLAATPWQELGFMWASGVFNLIGFLALINGLGRITVVHANAVSASQVAMSAVAGILLFAEPPSLWVLAGICLTIIGILRVDRPADSGEV